MLYFAFKNKLRIVFERTPEEPEKAVLPAIVFINTNHEFFGEDRHRGFMLIFGWWDWSVKFGLFY